MAVSVRTGEHADARRFVERVHPVAAPGPLNLTSQFIQYRVEMTSGDPDQNAPLADISISTGHPPVAMADSANVPDNGNHTFPASGPGSLTVNDTDADFRRALRGGGGGTGPRHRGPQWQRLGDLHAGGDYVGPDAFSYTVSDGVLTASATVSIDVVAGPARW